MLATKLTVAQAEAYRRTQRCPHCGGSLFIQADPDSDFREADLVCAIGCSRVIARIEVRPKPVVVIEAPRRGRPSLYGLGQERCSQCDGELRHDQRVRRQKYCSRACSGQCTR